MYRTILVPTDGSDAATAAVDHAVDLAGQYGATIHALYVVDGGSYASLEAGSEIVIEALRQEGNAAVETVVSSATDAGVDAEGHVLDGDAYRTILDYAADNDVDLIVMGTHGRRGLDRYLLGSVTERVVRTASVPVLTVRRESDADAGS